MKDLKGIRGKYYLQSLIEEGEHEHQDFKFAVSDARKIARSISAFANNDGGRLLIGVKDNGVIAGVRNEEDIYVVEQAASMCCEPPQPIKVTAIKGEGGLLVMRVEIDKSPRRPVMVKEADGKTKAYYRVHDENIAVSPLMLRAWRSESGADGVLINLDASGMLLLEMARGDGGTTVDSYMVRAHVSRRHAEDTAIALHGARLIDFRYNGNEFVLIAL